MNIGISSKKENNAFYVFEEDTLSTFDERVSELYKKRGKKFLEKRIVKCLPLGSVFDGYLGSQKIDILSVDTEGWDFKILKSNDWRKYRPKVIVIEVVSKECRKFLTDKEYRLFGKTMFFGSPLNEIYYDPKQVG